MNKVSKKKNWFPVKQMYRIGAYKTQSWSLGSIGRISDTDIGIGITLNRLKLIEHLFIVKCSTQKGNVAQCFLSWDASVGCYDTEYPQK